MKPYKIAEQELKLRQVLFSLVLYYHSSKMMSWKQPSPFFSIIQECLVDLSFIIEFLPLISR